MSQLTDSISKFDAFAAEHECLERSLSALGGLLTRRQDARSANATLAELKSHVMAHFEHEQQVDGFFESVIDQAPRLQRRAATLIQEHATMAYALKDLQFYASSNAPTEEWWSELAARFEDFRHTFCRHERDEIDLVQEAFHDDIGPGD